MKTDFILFLTLFVIIYGSLTLLLCMMSYTPPIKEYRGLGAFIGDRCPNCLNDNNLYSAVPYKFVSDKNYVSGDFYHVCDPKATLEYDHLSVLHLTYNEDEYEKAKQSVFNGIELSEKLTERYNGYVFYDIFQDQRFAYPYEFTRVAFSDEDKTLVFLHLDIDSVHRTDFYKKGYSFQEIIDEYFEAHYSF